MDKDEALDLALEALENHEGNYKLNDAGCDRHEKAITAIKQALAAQPAPVQEPEIDGATMATMAGMDASIGHLSALVDDLRLLLGCAMDNFKMLHNAAKSDDGPDMDAIIPAIVFAKFVNQDAALRYAIKHSAHDGMITTPSAAQPAPVQELIYQMQMMDGKWIDQAKQSYEYNKAHGHIVRIVYTTPAAQRQWTGLTDEEQSLLWEISRAALPRYATFYRLIEAKLKEKNNG